MALLKREDVIARVAIRILIGPLSTLAPPYLSHLSHSKRGNQNGRSGWSCGVKAITRPNREFYPDGVLSRGGHGRMD